MAGKETAEQELLVEDAFATGPPHDVLAQMRSEAPVKWCPHEHGGAWVVTRHADIATMSRDPATFSSYRGGLLLNPDQGLPLDVMRNFFIYKDPPEQTKYRIIFQSVFTPRAVAKLEPEVRRVVKRTLAAIEGGTCDFFADVAGPITVALSAEILIGVKPEDLARFTEWTVQIEHAILGHEVDDATATFVEMSAFLHELITEQAERGDRDTLVMRLRNARVDGESLTDEEILVIFGMLAAVAIDTTRNTAVMGMLGLLEHPEELARLRQNPELMPGAVEEVLRWSTVINYFCRTATRDTEVGGQTVSEGDRLCMFYASASRDEAVFEDAQRFDITRSNASDHNAFGGGGRHFCLGAGLARLVLRIMYEEFLAEYSHVELAGEPTHLRSVFVNGVTSLPLRVAA